MSGAVSQFFSIRVVKQLTIAEGYETRFGVCYVDYEGGQKRYPKRSAQEIRRIFESYMGKA